MNAKKLVTLMISVFAVLVGLGVAWLGGLNGPTIAGWPTLVLCAGVAFAVQWLAFVPAYTLRSEKFYDLVGGATYLLLLAGLGYFTPSLNSADWLLLAVCALWALRLGVFLALRVHKVGFDRRFEKLKTSFTRFLMSWTLQGLWVFFTLCPVLIVVASPATHSATVWTWVGLSLWLIGFSMEVLADWQKWQFKLDSRNEGRYISSGLWGRSRHPNYAGEILLWVGIFIACVPMLSGWQWVGVVSPLFITLLLTRISGIPILEENANKRWGTEPAYQDYKRKTPVLWPRLF